MDNKTVQVLIHFYNPYPMTQGNMYLCGDLKRYMKQEYFSLFYPKESARRENLANSILTRGVYQNLSGAVILG